MNRREWRSHLLGVGLLALGGLSLIGLGLLWVRSGPSGDVVVTTKKGTFAPAFVVCVGAVLVVLAVILLLTSLRERLAVRSFLRRHEIRRGDQAGLARRRRLPRR